MAQALVFDGTSSDNDKKPLLLLNYDIPKPKKDSLLVKMLAAPLNPLDLLVLQNEYRVRPQCSEDGEMIAGFDGVAEVISCAPEVQRFKPGDRVIIKRHGLGTWRTHAVYNVNDLLKIPKHMTIQAAAILRMGILNAYLLLQNNILHVRAGEWIIINAATSVVAHFLMQFARIRGINVISVIRDREDAEKEKWTLQRSGATVVLEEKELANTMSLEGKSIKLGLDAVFGEAGQRLVNTLSAESTYVVYGLLGGMEPGVHVKATHELIWLKNITFKGFRLSTALAAMKEEEQESLLALFSYQFQIGLLQMPLLDMVKWDSKGANADVLTDAVERARKPQLGQNKIVFEFV